MRIKIYFASLGLSLLILTGCGSTSSSSSVFENNPDSMKTNIIGTWKSSCIDSTIMTTTFTNTDKTGYEELYTDVNCTVLHFKSDFLAITYSIGEATTSKNAKESVEINFTYPNNTTRTTYSMVRTSDNKLYIANNDNLYGSDLIADRHNDFSASTPFTKQ